MWKRHLYSLLSPVLLSAVPTPQRAVSTNRYGRLLGSRGWGDQHIRAIIITKCMKAPPRRIIGLGKRSSVRDRPEQTEDDKPYTITNNHSFSIPTVHTPYD